MEESRNRSVLKSADSEEPANTRPISLLPILSKVCERAAHLQFTNFLDSNNVIHHLQSGNRKLHSTESALVHFTDELPNNMDQKKMSSFFLTCSKLSKASDTIECYVNFSKLVYPNFRVPGSKATNPNVKKSLKFSIPYVSDPLPPTVELQQGSIMRPVLFILYIKKPLSSAKTLRTTCLCG